MSKNTSKTTSTNRRPGCQCGETCSCGAGCACVSRLATTLKPEYAEALQAIDVDGTAVKTFAEQRGLTASNAGVRVFRAREALKKRVTESCGTCAEHGCRNCTCQAAP